MQTSSLARQPRRYDCVICALQRQQEMVQHQQTSGQWLAQVESAPTFCPTVQQFQDPISYIRSIQTEASKHGSYGVAMLAFDSARDLQNTLRLALRRHLQNRPAGGPNGAKRAGEALQHLIAHTHPSSRSAA